MNCYQILEVPVDASDKEIKKSYHKLAIKWHPDKNKDPKAKEYFQKINTAYQILNNKQSKKNYDQLSIIEKNKLYDLLCEKYKENIYFHFFKSFLTHSIYDNEEELKNDINNYNISGIINKFKTIHKKQNMKYNLKTNSNEKYNDKYRELKINNIIYHIPLREEEVTIERDTEHDIVIFIENIDDIDDINDNLDLKFNLNVSLSEFIFGFETEINIYGNTTKITLPSSIDHGRTHTIIGLGFPYTDENTDKVLRGDLIIELSIKNLTNENTIKTLLAL